MDNSIVDKIKKLLEITQANGATEAEEAAALEKANILMEKYQVERWQLKSKSKNVQKSFVCPERVTAEVGGLLREIGDFFAVLSLVKKSTNEFIYYGAVEQVELALEMAKRALHDAEINHGKYCLTDEYRAERRFYTRRQLKVSFINGFYYKVAIRLQELTEQRRQSIKSQTGTDLIVLNNETLSNDYEKDFECELGETKGRKSRTEISNKAFVEGVNKGETFRIVDELSED